MSALSVDQRWLLLHIGGWAIVDALLSPAGTDHLMQSMSGSTGGNPPQGGPEWLCGWQTRAGKIVSPWRGQPHVVVSAAQIKRYGKQLPADGRAELVECRAARSAETMRTEGWCHCPWKDHSPNAHSGPCRRYHPTDAEDRAHLDNLRRIEAWETTVLRRALGVDAGQLALFDPPTL